MTPRPPTQGMTGMSGLTALTGAGGTDPFPGTANLQNTDEEVLQNTEDTDLDNTSS